MLKSAEKSYLYNQIVTCQTVLSYNGLIIIALSLLGSGWLAQTESEIVLEINKLLIDIDDLEFVEWVNDKVYNSTELSTEFIVQQIYSII